MPLLVEPKDYMNILQTKSINAEWKEKEIQAIKTDKELLKKNSVDAGNGHNINSKIKIH